MENTTNMDQFSSSGFENDDETRTLILLLNAFGSVCSLDEIADAYCKAERDANRTGEILYQLQTSKSSGEVQASNKGLDHPESTQSLHEHTAVETTLSYKKSKGRSSKASAYLGTASSVMGRTYCKTAPSLNEPSRTSKPLIVEVKGSIEEDHEIHEIERITSLMAALKASIRDKDVEEFLFSMLGDGFQLRKDAIQEVLGQCGYNVKDSMEELLALSNKGEDKQKDLNCDTAQNVTGASLEIKACGSSQSHPSSSSSERNSMEQSNLDKETSSLSREILESLFHAPARSDEEPRKRLEWGLNRTRVLGQQVVSQPLESVPQPPPISIRHIRPDFEDALDENDQYSLLRKAAKQHWSTMKEYYVASVDAFNDGDRTKASYLLEQGKYYNQLAREADEKSQQEILNMKSNEQCDVPLDLHEHNPKEAVKLLKVHIRSLASMPSFRYLKVVLETDPMDAKKGRRRRSVTKFLEKESITWTEEDGNPGTILIKLDDINPDKLNPKNDMN